MVSDEFVKYRNYMLSLVGDRDPVEILRESLAELYPLVTDASEQALSQSPAPEEWSAWQVLTHLADAEMMFGTRVRLILTAEQPPIVGYDQEAWMARFGGLDVDAHETFQRWAALRRNHLHLYDSITPEEMDRIGMHTERGPESIRDLLLLSAGHDLAHIDQIRRCVTGS